MKVKWLGLSCFIITSSDGLKVLTDPYEPGGFDGVIGYGPIREEVDVVTISHDHADHNYVQGLSGAPLVVKSAAQAKGVVFDVVSAFHDTAQGSQRGENNIFLFEVDGIRICHLGDLGHELTAEQVKALGRVDILLLPVGGTYTIDANVATKIMEAVTPKVVIPMHFKTPKLDSFPIQSVEPFLKGKQRVKRWAGSEVEFTADTLPNQTEIVVLQPAL